MLSTTRSVWKDLLFSLALLRRPETCADGGTAFLRAILCEMARREGQACSFEYRMKDRDGMCIIHRDFTNSLGRAGLALLLRGGDDAAVGVVS
jgi:hypothetical protein